jgi:trigger factor
VTCKNIQKRSLPGLNDDFANSIRPGLTFEELKQEVLSALAGEGDKKKYESRDKGLEEELLKVVEVEIPETLVTERARQKFAIMMTDVSSSSALLLPTLRSWACA